MERLLEPRVTYTPPFLTPGGQYVVAPQQGYARLYRFGIVGSTCTLGGTTFSSGSDVVAIVPDPRDLFYAIATDDSSVDNLVVAD